MNPNQERLIQFQSIEQRYVASCYPLPDRPGADVCLDWRHTFSNYVDQHLTLVSTKISQLAEPFPHLARLAFNGLFDKISIQSYFEGLDFPETANGATYHNPNLYLFASKIGRIKKNMSDPSIVLSVLDHVRGCSVKPAQLSTSTVIDYQGQAIESIDTHFIQTDMSSSDFVLVHGYNPSNQHLAIRHITSEEFTKFKNWFIDRQHSTQNPFLTD